MTYIPGGGGGGGGSISSSADVALSNTADNQTLVYDTGLGLWRNGEISTAGLADGAVTAAKVATDIAKQADVDSINTVLGPDPAGGLSTVTARLAAVESQINAGAGDVGLAGAEVVSFGVSSSTEAIATDDVFGPYVAPVDYTLLNGSASLRGGTASELAEIDIEMCPSGITGPWTSIFLPADRLKITAGNLVALSGNATTTSLPAGGALRAKVLTAPAAGGATVWRGVAALGDGTSTSPTSVNIPVSIAGLAAGDMMISSLFVSSPTATWPSGWSPLSVSPVGLDSGGGGPFYLHIATKTASASESPSQPVTFVSSRAVMVTAAVAAAVVNQSASAIVADGTNTTSRLEPAATTLQSDSIIYHIAAVRLAGGLTPGTITWDGGLTPDIQTASAAIGVNPNVSLSVAHEIQSSPGAITRRTASWAASTNAGRTVMAAIIIEPTVGTTAKGLSASIRIRQVS